MYSLLGNAFNSVLDKAIDLIFPLEDFQIDWLKDEEV